MKKTKLISEVKIGYLFILPALIFLGVWWLFPMIYSFFLSFVKWDFISPHMKWIGIGNYRKLALRSEFHQVLGATFCYTVGMVGFSLVGGLILAIIVNRKLRGISVFRALIFSPYVTPAVAASLIWIWIYEPEIGLANSILQLLKLPKLQWLGSSTWAMPAIIIFSSWKNVGYCMIYFLAGLQNIPKTIYQAAEIDGAGRWEQFRHITLPLLSPMVFFLLIIMSLLAFNVFDEIKIMTQGGPAGATRTLVYYLYMHGFQFFNMGYASAVAIFILLIAFCFTILQFKLSGKWVHY